MATSKAQNAPANSRGNANDKTNGAIKVVMPDANGDFTAPISKGAVEKVQVVDVDMVLQLKDGTSVVLAGGAISAMDASHTEVKFSDGPQGLSNLFDLVGTISIPQLDPILSSLQGQQDANGNQGSNDPDSPNSSGLTASVTSQIVNQLTQIVQVNSQSVTIQTIDPTAQVAVLSQNTKTGDATSQPLQHVEPPLPPEKPGVIPQQHIIGPDAPAMALTLVNLTGTKQAGNVLYGSGGTPASATDGSNNTQFASQIIDAPDSATVIHAISNIPPNDFIKVVNITLTGNGIAQSITIKGVPAGMSIANGTDLGGGVWSVAVVNGQRDYGIQIEYTTVPADPSAPIHQQFSLEFDVSMATADGVVELAQVKQFVIKDVNSANDLTYIDSTTGEGVYVLPAQGNSHIIHAGDAGVTIYGSNAADFLYGGAGNDIIHGGTGNTYFEGGAGADQLIGGDRGINTVGYTQSATGVTVDLVNGVGSGGDATGDTLTNIQNVIGSAHDDKIISGVAANNINGGGGVDTVSYEGSATGVTVNLITGAGLGGNAQGDVLTGIQNVIGSAHNDTFIASAAANTFTGGGRDAAGFGDMVSYANDVSGMGVTVDLSQGIRSAGAAQGDVFIDIDGIIGTAFDDVFIDGAGANRYEGGIGGQDTVSYIDSTAGVTVNLSNGRGIGGYAEGDNYVNIQNVVGSSHNDVFIAGVDSKTFTGGGVDPDGFDTVSFSASGSAVTINSILNTGVDASGNSFTFTDIQKFIGSNYDDTFIASAAANIYDGGSGSDTVDYSRSNDAVTVDLTNTNGIGTSGGYAQGDKLIHIFNVIGSDHDDIFVASNDANAFEGGAGSNTVSYAASNFGVIVDLTNTSGPGTSGGYALGDTFSHIQNLIGSQYDDVFVASADANRFDGGTGGTANGGVNTVSYSQATTGVTVDLSNTTGEGTGGGAAGDSFIRIQNLIGSAFDDTFVASNVANVFDGGADGSDTVSYAQSDAAVSVDLSNATGAGTGGGFADGDKFIGIENVIGSNYSDTFYASGAANRFDGGTGSDTVSYARAADGNGVTVNLFDSTGSGGIAAGDTYFSIENVTGTQYDDTFIDGSGLAANAYVGGSGSDTISYANSTAGVTVNFVTGQGSGTGTSFAINDTYNSIENVIGSKFDDTLVAAAVDGRYDGGDSVAGSHNRLDFSSIATTGVTINLVDNTASTSANSYTLANIQDVTGTAQDDTIVASSDANNIDGGISTADSHNRVSYANSDAGVTVDLVLGTGTGGYAEGDVLSNIQDLTGSAHDDTFIASAAANYFDGGDGVDTVSYANTAGDNSIDLKTAGAAATGNGYAKGDTYTGIENVIGGEGNDTFFASAVANQFDGRGGNNTVDYSKSDDGFGVIVDLINGTGAGNGAGNEARGDAAGDTYANVQNVTGTAHDDWFVASDEANKFDGGDGVDTVSYANTAGDNSIDLKTAGAAATGTGYANGDTYIGIENVIGGTDNDIFFASAAANKFEGGGGNNTVDYSKSNDAFGVIVDLVGNKGAGNGTGNEARGDAAGDTYVDIQNATGTAHDDKFIASDAVNKFDGQGGAHNLVSYEFADDAVSVDLSTTVGTGTGGDAQGDTYINIQDATGGAGDDTFIASDVANNFDGGGGMHNLVSYIHSMEAVTVDLSTAVGTGTGGDAQGDTYKNIQDVIGGSGDDKFFASAAANKFDGGGGNNTVDYSKSNDAFGVIVDLLQNKGFGNGTGNEALGDAGGDTYISIQNATGTAHDDLFIASGVANKFDGGDGVDTVSYAGTEGDNSIDLKNGVGTATGGGYADGDKYTGIENVIGGTGDDTFFASAAANKFDGGGGNNTVDYSKSTDGFGVIVDLVDNKGAGNGTDHAAQGDAAGDTYVDIQNAIGTAHDDIFVASAEVNNFDGRGGSNTVDYSKSGDAFGVIVDLFNGTGAGNGAGNEAQGDAAGDAYTSIQNAIGTDQDDIFIASADANKFDGGISGPDSHNLVSYVHSVAGVTVDLSAVVGTGTGGLAEGDTYINIQDVIGGDGDDTFFASAAANNFDGGDGNNTVNYSKSTNAAGVTVNLAGGVGAGGDAEGDTYLRIQNATGTSHDDLFVASNVANKFDGGDGVDTVSYVDTEGDNSIDLKNGVGSGTGYADGDKYISIENVIGGKGNDTFFASAAANRFDGGGGNNTVDYSKSTDTFGVIVDLFNRIGAGNGTGHAAQGDAAGDTYANIQNVTGTAQDDIFIASADANKFDGGTSVAGSHNRVSYASSTVAETVNLSTGLGSSGPGGLAQGDSYVNIQDVTGGSGDDIFVASNVANNFDGGTSVVGSHNLVSYEFSTNAVTVNLKTGLGTGGYAQDDTYIHIQDATGGSGDDIFVASDVANNFDGGAGSDTVDYSAATLAIVVDLSEGAAAASGDALAAGDTYLNMENIVGGKGADKLTGATGGNSTLTGGRGADQLIGHGTNNTASYKGAGAGVTIDLRLGGVVTATNANGDERGDTFTNIQNVIGSSFNDIFYASSDANKLDGGAAGSDTVSYERQNDDSSVTVGVNVDLSTGVAAGTGGYAEGDTYANIRNLVGTKYDDTLIGNSAGGSTLTGGAGADALTGQGFDSSSAARILATANTANYATSADGVTVDLVHGRGHGGDAEGDTLSGIQNIIGSAADDTFIIAASKAGGAANPNTVDGGSGGVDTVSYANETNAVTVDLSTATGHGYTTADSATKDTLIHIQNAIGGAGDDTFIAGNLHNSFDGGSAGSDTVSYASSGTGTVVDSAHDTIAITGVIVDLYGHTGSGNWATGDTYASIENIIGSKGSDLFISDDSGTANKYNGGTDGSDTVSYEHASTSFEASLLRPGDNTGVAQGDTYTHISNLMGSAESGVTSTLFGDGAANTLTALGTDTINILYGGGASGGGSDILDGRQGGTNTLHAGDTGNTIFEVNTDGTGNLAANIIGGGVHGSSAAGATATMKIFGMDQGIQLNMHSFNGHADNLTMVDLKDGVNTNITIDYSDVLALGKNGGENGVELTLNLDDRDSVTITDIAGKHWQFYGDGDYVFYDNADTSNTHALATLHTRPTA